MVRRVVLEGAPASCSLGLCKGPRLHVYDSLYNSMNNLPKSQIGIQFFIRHLLQWSVNTFQQKSIKNLIEIDLWQEIVPRIVWRFVREIAHVDGP
jgi:hypothetical protein